MSFSAQIWKWIGIILALFWIALPSVGCALNQPTTTEQPAQQQIEPVTRANQEQLTSGTDGRYEEIRQVGVDNRGYVPGELQTAWLGDVVAVGPDGEPVRVKMLPVATYIHSQTQTQYFTQAGGDTTPTGTTSGTGSGTGTISPSTTQTPTAHQQPEAAVSVPIAVGMPGSAPTAQSSAASRGGTASPTQTATPTTHYFQAMIPQASATPEILKQIFDLGGQVLGVTNGNPIVQVPGEQQAALEALLNPPADSQPSP